ncbi:hypothetical protein AAE478_006992 [Parahypoxylon ruwenzoriense]
MSGAGPSNTQEPRGDDGSQGRGELGGDLGTRYGFSMPDSDFDPADNEDIKAHYRSKEAGRALADEDGTEETVEEEARRTVADWEKEVGRKATDEERERMMAKVRRIRSGGWLEGAKKDLVGKTTVPISWFNRLVAENERTIGFVSQMMDNNTKAKREKDEMIRKLQDEIQELGDGKSANNEGYDDCQERLDEMTEKATGLQRELDECKARGERLQDRIERQDAELRTVHNNVRARSEEIDHLRQQLGESRARERGLRDRIEEQDDTIERCGNDVFELEQKLEEAESKAKDSGSSERSDIKPRKADGAKSNDTGEDKEGRMERVARENGLREFWEVLQSTKNEMGEMQNRLLNFFGDLGFNDKEFSATEALNHLTEALDKLPRDVTNVKLAAIRVMGELAHVRMLLGFEKDRVATLRLQIENRKTDEEVEHEIKMQYKIFNEEEIEKRVDERTQMYRMHRRDILDNIFEAYNTLAVILMKCPDEATRTAIQDICQRCLSPTSLPKPRRQEAR